MNNAARNDLYLALADNIFAECKTIPSHVDACECKRKRDLRDGLYTLCKAAEKAGCSDASIKIAGRIKDWLHSGEVRGDCLFNSAGAELTHQPTSTPTAVLNEKGISYLVLGDKPILHPGNLDRDNFIAWLSNFLSDFKFTESCLVEFEEAAKDNLISAQKTLQNYRSSISENLTTLPRETTPPQDSTGES